MQLAICRAMKSVSMALLLLVIAFLVAAFAAPIANATPPVTLGRFPSVGKESLEPGGSMTFSWALAEDISEFLLYYDVTGDLLRVYINDVSYWQPLAGKGWRFCDGCEFSKGTHDVIVVAPFEATEFCIVFYAVPQPPVDFAGFIPANSIEALSEFGVIFPSSSTNYTLVLGVTGGSYRFFIDDTLETTVTRTTTLRLDLGGDFHALAVDATNAGVDVTWTLEIQGPPRLAVTIVYPQSRGCNATLNPKSGQSVCVAGAAATPSDGGNPAINYSWTASGGRLNSTTSQWVQWTAPPSVANFTLTVEASAPGYSSGSDSLSVQVVPEFPSFIMPVLLLLVIGITAGTQGRSRKT